MRGSLLSKSVMEISLHPKERRRIRTQKLALVESGICTKADLDIILQAGIDLVQLVHKRSVKW